MDSIITQLIEVGGMIVVTLGNVILTNKMSNRKKNDKIRESVATGMRYLLRNSIVDKCKKYIKLGYCHIHIKQQIEEEFKVYHDELGGNGTVTRLYNRFLDLDFTEGGEEDE